MKVDKILSILAIMLYNNTNLYEENITYGCHSNRRPMPVSEFVNFGIFTKFHDSSLGTIST